MKKILLSLVLVFVLNSCTQKKTQIPANTHHSTKLINWRSALDENVFKEAKEKNKPVILSLEAIWCHWCHVMKAETYSKKEIADTLNEKFIPVSVDHDANAFLANRYRRWGWPATIIFNPDGQEIVKRAGYIEAPKMKKLLAEVLENPNRTDEIEEVKYSKTSYLSDDFKNKLEKRFYKSLDTKIGGLAINLKYLDRDSVEYALMRSKTEEDEAKLAQLNTFVDKTLKNVSKYLVDSEWGGFYQYSTYRSWDHQHYEKLARTQADYLRIYSLAYAFTKDPVYKDTIYKTISYLDQFFTNPDGSFCASQDADLVQGEKATDYFKLSDAQRKKQGIPKVDKTAYADKNARMAEGLLQAYKVTLDEKILERASKALATIETNHFMPDLGLYRHKATSDDSFLSDNVYMSKAMLSMYEVTAERKWLKKSLALAQKIAENFKNDSPGYIPNIAKSSINNVLKPEPVLDQNIKLARLFNLLYHYSANDLLKNEAKYVMKYLASEKAVFNSLSEPGILLADFELAEDPAHFTIVGSKKNKKSLELYNSTLSYDATYLRTEWYDPDEGRLLNHDVEYPNLGKPALFNCENKTCSLPIYDLDEA